MRRWLKNMGPGVLVAAAFIGPGTVTTATLAGANYGYTLLWALLFATLATIILQEMSARLGIVTQRGLGQTLLEQLHESIFKWPMIALLLTALYGGNAAYEAGNLTGAVLGVEAIFEVSGWTRQLSILCLTIVAAMVIWKGTYQHIERILVVLVSFMAVAFALTFFVVRPDLSTILSSLFRPSIPTGSLLTIIALIGTTVVPYNLFLQASAAHRKWSTPSELPAARLDTVVSIGLGGLLTILITSTAAASFYQNTLSVTNAADMASQFAPLFGQSSKYLFGFGLLAAGLSSAITAPLATGYAVSELSGVNNAQNSLIFKGVSLSVLFIGSLLALTEIKPLTLILLAQFANGLLLPIIATFLLIAMNSRHLGTYKNGWLANSLGLGVVLLTTLLGVRLIAKALGYV